MIPISMAVLPSDLGARGADLLGECGVAAQRCCPWQPAVPPAVGGLVWAPRALCNPSCCQMLGCSILRASTDTNLTRNQSAPHYSSYVLLEYPPSRILKKVLSDIRYNTANHGYSWMFLLISAHLKTELTKKNRLMQTSDDGNTSIGREVAVKCSNALPLIFAAHI